MGLGLSTMKMRARDVDHSQYIPYSPFFTDHVQRVELMYSKLYILTEG